MPRHHWDWSIPVPLSQGWRVGNLVFVGGQVALDERGNVVGPGDRSDHLAVALTCNVATVSPTTLSFAVLDAWLGKS